ncbi:MAG: hypothetical protein K8S97_08495 [Anaerolineae bacterium]|nr:hypothetical protein [Anaerolineae bacterium]
MAKRLDQRLTQLEQHARHVDDQRIKRIARILATEPDSPRAVRLRELFDIARQRRDQERKGEP